MDTDVFAIALQILQVFSYILIGSTKDPLQEEYGILKHASILHRHGDRSPLMSYPRDPHKDYPWLDGFGQLQNKGKRRMVEVGKWFRMRYQNFINETYTRHEIQVDSSALDRCVMSALCLLYGFYPAIGEQIWMADETWQPIPVYAIPKSNDNMLLQSKKCELREVFAAKDATDPKYVNTFNENETLIKDIFKEAGIDMVPHTITQIFKLLDRLSDTLKVYRENNLSLSKWANDTIRPLNTILTKTTRNFTFDAQQARLRCGPFLESVIEDMRRKLTDKEYKQKLHIYSAHDFTIWTIMTGLRVYDNALPAYGSSLIFELREKNSVDYVTISYRNDTDAPDARLLNVPGCGLTCTFHQFHESMKPLIPENWKSECNLRRELIPNVIIMSVFVHLVCKRHRLTRLRKQSNDVVHLSKNIVFSGV